MASSSNNTNAVADHSQSQTVQIRFQTRLPAGFQVADTPIEVPDTLRKTGLNEIVNHLLGVKTPKDFEFVVEGELLKGSIRSYMKKNGISSVRMEELPSSLSNSSLSYH